MLELCNNDTSPWYSSVHMHCSCKVVNCLGIRSPVHHFLVFHFPMVEDNLWVTYPVRRKVAIERKASICRILGLALRRSRILRLSIFAPGCWR